MTQDLTSAERAFLAYDWAGSQEWQQYYNNLYPTPPLDRLAKYKRTWFRREVDASLPADSTIGDQEPQQPAAEATSTTSANAATTPRRGFFQGPFSTKKLLIRMELIARGLYLFSTFVMIFFTFIRLLPIRYVVASSQLATISFFLFLILALMKDSTPSWSFEWIQSVFMNENMHYLSYGAAVLSLPKTLLFTTPQILTCLIGMDKLYKYHLNALPLFMKTRQARQFFRLMDEYNSILYKGRAMTEIGTLVHMFLGIFGRGMGILNFVLYTNFIKLKISVHDVYLLAAFRQINGTITNMLSSPILPPMALSIYQTVANMAVRYFKPQRT